jgi:hypothetical protein
MHVVSSIIIDMEVQSCVYSKGLPKARPADMNNNKQF